MSDLHDRIIHAAEQRDRQEMRELAREYGHEVEEFFQYYGARLSPSEREFAHREFDDARR